MAFLGRGRRCAGVYVISHPESIHSLGDIFRSWQGGNNFYGCILGGLTGSILYWLRRPFPFRRMADAAALAVATGIAIGRIGCFLNGCCYGAVSNLPWAVTFPAGSHAWVRQVDAGLISPTAASSLPVHPTQLYASLAGFVLLGVIAGVFPSPPCRRRDDGRTHDRLSDHPLAAGNAAWGRAGHFRRHDLVAEYQRGPVCVRAGRLVLAAKELAEFHRRRTAAPAGPPGSPFPSPGAALGLAFSPGRAGVGGGYG